MLWYLVVTSYPNTERCRTTVAPPPHRAEPPAYCASAAVVSAGDEPNGGTRTTPGMICAVARCCCSGKMLGQIANSNTAPILKIMPKEALDIISQYRECQTI